MGREWRKEIEGRRREGKGMGWYAPVCILANIQTLMTHRYVQ